ncbi:MULTISPECIES: GlxA family transcriptional regulator [unclassified Undibacterium]|uniref:GlxA family transcriptional regulator n=1 Tax=unclassified Undibacterium TaxID=2630295 RepID=UPI002AC8A8ED|nr:MULTISPECIES: DJ-1/PfpI family protein [unclassified Undibacterium]MEB0137442.1 DJ-1/PfpI family protein [Undibacterium sp. CCC2.1]MEB0170893.1 DJ-1/PfpI family protein [Undibacterium sp. CCC1.1]MEB0174845.1 DJ-1/PfpI family protein [Undibacterium sp. CCC3.4]MEB0214181.1 DJ-1/PfpI family protein [Undibacterium sp. 5I2]WPX44492.1 DJ-1/PfpI family protein [Undibacterium sp. CCC3.4]
MSATSLPAARTVDLIVYPGFKALEAIGPMSVFEYANVHRRRQGLPAAYDVRIVAQRCGTVASDTLMSLQADKALSLLALPDDAIIVGSRQIASALSDNPALIDWLREAAGRIGRLAGLCSGAFFLAEAGLLNGQPATTHWSVAQQFEQDYPAVKVDADAIFIRSGNIWTSAGVTAAIDLALAFVEADCGHALALEVASDLVVYLKRPGGQSQFSSHLLSQKTSQWQVRDLQQWMCANLQHDLSNARLAALLDMSVRNFSRHFLAKTGMTPQAFVDDARVELAQQLLAADGAQKLALKAIAARCGVGSADQLRRLLQKHGHLSPRAYRAALTG